jgi:YD repeat-containing protein
MAYNSLNLLTSSTDAIGNVTSYQYGTNAGRLYLPASIQKYATGSLVSTTAMDYEDVGTGSTKACGVLKKETVAAGTSDQAETDYTHNANGFVTSITKPTGTSDPAVVINCSYNLRGELVAETDALGRTTNYAYDGRGNRIWTEWHDEGGTLVSWQYNYYNRNGEIEWTQGPRYNPDDYVLKRYDAAGRLSEETKWRSQQRRSSSAKRGCSIRDHLLYPRCDRQRH